MILRAATTRASPRSSASSLRAAPCCSSPGRRTVSRSSRRRPARAAERGSSTLPANLYRSPATVCRGTRFEWGRRTYIMGVINVTPNSFSGDGVMDVDAAVAQGMRFAAEGADILDVGGESTRPPSTARVEGLRFGKRYGQQAGAISAEEEASRVVPVIERLAKEVSVPISVDTYKAEVARRALAAGASVINDVWGLKADPGVAEVAAEARAPLILMHNQHGTQYVDFLRDVRSSLERSAVQAMEAGVAPERIILDPGFGFGKTPQHNLELLRRLRELKTLGYPLLVGTSRKSTIGLVLGLPAEERVEGTAATVAVSITNGADIVRVHDVKAMARVAKMTDAIVRGWAG
ncbi:MAG: dihydropteroate synthase [Chloroflexi bacterium]|nr:dihydropteroate synthase [Chloroflexota bacterium]